MSIMPSMYLSRDGLDPKKIYQGDIFAPVTPLFYLPNKPDNTLNLFRLLEGIWYEYTENELKEKGERVWVEDEFIMVRARKKNIIIISQTCDIHEEGLPDLRLPEGQEFKNPFIIYAPIFSFDEIQFGEQKKKDIRNQRLINTFYLEKNEELGIPESVVWLNHFCSILKSRINRFDTFGLENRIASLRPPWREALAHTVGNLFSRVALPSEVVFR
jgi:hypothetical protein